MYGTHGDPVPTSNSLKFPKKSIQSEGRAGPPVKVPEYQYVNLRAEGKLFKKWVFSG
jgi:hypothetical protein